MAFTWEFTRILLQSLVYVSPLLISLILLIALIGQFIGRWEGWSRSDALYYAFITASTVGYGDFHPRRARSKFWAVCIALLGLILTGLVVALGVQAAGIAFKSMNPQVDVLLKTL